MLVKFTVGNFLSFKNKVVVDLNATTLTEYRDDNIVQSFDKRHSLLKSLILYGANSSGKSNMFKAIKFMRRMILNSSKDSQADERIRVEPFLLSSTTLKKPSFFEIEFIIKKVKYIYGFEVDSEKIHKEWLYQAKKTTNVLLYERKRQQISITNKFDSASKPLTGITRENALFLSVCAQFNISSAISIIKAISDIQYTSGTDDRATIDFTIEMLNDASSGNFVSNFIKGANLGFSEIKTEKISLTKEMLSKSKVPKEIQKLLLKSKEENTLISTKHTVFDKENQPMGDTYFNMFANESLGTRKYFSLAGPIIDTLLSGKTLIIDEFDARLHPILSKSIIKLFNSADNNPNNAQLIFASHNSSFINSKNDLFRRDQILIVEKDEYGASNLETLYNKKVRKDASFEKDYLLGNYQGIPIDLEITNELPKLESEV